ncbi:MAG TPA: nucleoside recognition domain-containing protein [Bacteroidia bacterium]|nr:nucleoside recognition domain-containing protein [Bacteroidia bacterium]
MVLNYIWIGFFVVGFLVAVVRTIYGYAAGSPEDAHVFEAIGMGTFASAKTAATVALGLTGIITLWMGFMRIGEKAGVVNFLGRLIGPFFSKLFPGIPKGHPAQGHIMLNFSANMLGLSNAATPMGLKAMESLQELNPDKERASDSMIMFLAMNTASLTLIPVTILGLRAANGAANPTDVFVPILIASFCATLVAMITVAIRQRILSLPLLGWLLGGTAIMAGVIRMFMIMSPEVRSDVSSIGGNFILMGIIVAFLTVAMFKRVRVYDAFIEGAKDGFTTVIKIIPYLVAMIVAIGVFRNCGAMDYLVAGCTWFFEQLGVDTRFTPALPIAFMKPLSGGGTEGLVVSILSDVKYGADSFVGRLASVMYASADTTFYIVALYFGAVGIKNTRYAVGAGLIADLAGIVAAIFVTYLFFG